MSWLCRVTCSVWETCVCHISGLIVWVSCSGWMLLVDICFDLWCLALLVVIGSSIEWLLMFSRGGIELSLQCVARNEHVNLFTRCVATLVLSHLGHRCWDCCCASSDLKYVAAQWWCICSGTLFLDTTVRRKLSNKIAFHAVRRSRTQKEVMSLRMKKCIFAHIHEW